MLKAGDPAPVFSLPNEDMRIIDLKDYIGKQTTVIFFYPKDNTPGCTLEATEFSDLTDEFASQSVALFGVSRDTCNSHAAFRDKFGLDISLLADVEGEMGEAYGVWQEKEKNGKKAFGTVRSTFIIDSKGVVQHAIYGVVPAGHAEQVLILLDQLGS